MYEFLAKDHLKRKTFLHIANGVVFGDVCIPENREAFFILRRYIGLSAL
jgi:hypothetical protein